MIFDGYMPECALLGMGPRDDSFNCAGDIQNLLEMIRADILVTQSIEHPDVNWGVTAI